MSFLGSSETALPFRFMLLGLVIIVGGTLIAVTGAEVGESSGIIGAIVIVVGTGLLIEGVIRWRSVYRQRRDGLPERHRESTDGT